jgi:hypothetical protein
VEFRDPVLRIERVVCDAGATCAVAAEAAPSVLVAFSPSELVEGRRTKPFPQESSTMWLEAGKGEHVRSTGNAPAHLLRIVLLEH